jgi:hypothetical protein
MPETLGCKLAFTLPEGVLHDGENMVDLFNIGNTDLILQWVEILIPETPTSKK